MPVIRVIAVFAVAALLGGCEWSQKVGARVAPDTVSLGDRCAAIMKEAMPFAEIDIDDRTAANPDVRTIIAKVTGTRADMPDNTRVDRKLAMECTFTDSVLTGFRWTKGGPPPPP